MSHFKQYLLGMALVIVGVNILGSGIVNYLSWQKISKLEEQTENLYSRLTAMEIERAKEAPPTPPAPLSASPQVATPEASKNQAVAAPPAQPISTSATPVAPQVITKTVSPIKEQTVFIGSGSSSSTNWTDIDSAAIELNSANYPGVTKVLFEATLSIVGGEAQARLKNKTTGGIIYPSEVKHSSSTASTVLSSSFVLASGSNEYIVQLRSSSSEKVVLDAARLRLFYR